MTDYRARQAAFHDLRDALIRAQDERPHLQGIVRDGELEWIAYERAVMTDRVNMLRSRRGLGPVSSDVVRRAEDRAVGHVDYTQKFAIGCADLVIGDDA